MQEKSRVNRFAADKNPNSEHSSTIKHPNMSFGMNVRESKSLARPTITNPNLMQPFSSTKGMEVIAERSDTRYYYLGKGNNHQVIKRVLSTRKNYTQTTNASDFVYFKWKQNSYPFKYQSLGKDCLCFNHFEFHRQITNKQRLVWNMIAHCQTNKLNAFSYIPTTYIIDLTTGEQDLALHSFLMFFKRNIPEGYKGPKVHSILLPRSKFMPYLSPQQLHKKSQGNFYCKPLCPKTFFSDSGAYLWILKPTFMNRGRGVSLFNNLEEFEKLIWKYYEGEGLEDYDSKTGLEDFCRTDAVVRIFTDPDQIQEKTTENKISLQEINQTGQNNLNKEKSQKAQKIVKQQKTEKVWKVEKVQKTDRIVSQKEAVSNKQVTTPNILRVLSFVVQKYIECPMLINQRKFDIRVWVLLSQNYQVFFFKQGYLRFSSYPYSTENHSNPFIHLTNNSVQKHSSEYNEQSGNQISLSALERYLPNQTYYVRIICKIRQIIWLSMCSVRRKINVNCRKDCFQIFGYDFMVDAAYKVWLIEVNTNPSIDETSGVLRQLIPRMIDDAFKLTIDKMFSTSFKESRETFSVDGFNDQENMWELLGDFREGINEKTMGKRWTIPRR